MVFDHNYHYWFTDAAGNSPATINSAQQHQRCLYYLKWKEDPSIQEVRAY